MENPLKFDSIKEKYTIYPDIDGYIVNLKTENPLKFTEAILTKEEVSLMVYLKQISNKFTQEEFKALIDLIENYANREYSNGLKNFD